jgi:hypothetical protein
MKSGDAVVAVASLTVIYVLIYSALSVALVPMISAWGLNVAFVVSVLVSGLIVGYFFAGRIREEPKMVSLGKMVILFAFVIMLFVLIGSGGGHSSAMIDENLENMYDTSSWTNTDWFAYETMAGVGIVSVNILLALVLSFVGLYLGSMLKPSAKAKE